MTIKTHHAIALVLVFLVLFGALIIGMGKLVDAVEGWYPIETRVSMTVDYNCGNYGHSATLFETVDNDDPMGVPNAHRRLDNRVIVEINKLKKQGCTPYAVG